MRSRAFSIYLVKPWCKHYIIFKFKHYVVGVSAFGQAIS